MESALKNSLANFNIKGYDKSAVKVANAYLNLYVKKSAENFKEFDKKYGGRSLMNVQFLDKNYPKDQHGNSLFQKSIQKDKDKKGGRVVLPVEYFGKNSGRYIHEPKVGGRIVMPSEYYGKHSERYFRAGKEGGSNRKIIPQTDRNHAWGNAFNVSNVTFKNVANKHGADKFPKYDLCAIKKNFEEDMGEYLKKVGGKDKLTGKDLMSAFKKKLY